MAWTNTLAYLSAASVTKRQNKLDCLWLACLYILKSNSKARAHLQRGPPENIRLSRKKFGRDKHIGLFVRVVSDEDTLNVSAKGKPFQPSLICLGKGQSPPLECATTQPL